MSKRPHPPLAGPQVYALLQPDCIESGLVERAIEALRSAGFSVVKKEEISLVEADLRQMYHRYFVEHKAFANKLLKLHIGHISVVLELTPPANVPTGKLFDFITKAKKSGTPGGKPSIRQYLGSESAIRNRIHMPGSVRENKTLREISIRRSRSNSHK